MKGARTGDTLANEKNQILLEVIKFPEPVIAMAVEPKTKQDLTENVQICCSRSQFIKDLWKGMAKA